MSTVYERVKGIVVDKLGADEDDVSEGSSFVDDLNADSLDLVELIMAFEEEFSTEDSPWKSPTRTRAPSQPSATPWTTSKAGA